jgi:hypothetical protein
MRKFLILVILITLMFFTVSCNQKSDCESTINSIIKENKTLEPSQISDLKQQNLNRYDSIFPKFREGNQGINPPVSYFVGNSARYYYVNGGMYTEVWYGPYSGKLPTHCFFPMK